MTDLINTIKAMFNPNVGDCEPSTAADIFWAIGDADPDLRGYTEQDVQHALGYLVVEGVLIDNGGMYSWRR